MHETVNDIAKAIATELIELYNTANIPVIAFNSAFRKVKRLIEKVNDL